MDILVLFDILICIAVGSFAVSPLLCCALLLLLAILQRHFVKKSRNKARAYKLIAKFYEKFITGGINYEKT